MAGKAAVVNFNKCRPENCEGGVCPAIKACSHRLLKQEKLYDFPMTDSGLCQGCGNCARACPLNAIEIVKM